MAGEMLSITTPSHSDPSKYQLSTLPQPVVSEPTDVVIKVYAASINPVDVKKAAGVFQLALRDEFPYKIGYDCAGIVTAVGDGVTRLEPGDEVYVRLPEASRGSWSEYAKCADFFVALKPKTLSFEDAASLPLASMTALQALRKYNGSLEGKTVFIPAGLSGTGSYACQLAKNVFKAGKVITTVSTAKVAQVPQLLGEGVVDEVIDYTTQDPTTVILRGSVDFLFDTTGHAMQYLSLMVPTTGTIVSISTTPSGTQLQSSNVMRRPDNPRVPLLMRAALDLLDGVRRARAWRWGVAYTYMFLESKAEDLDDVTWFVDRGDLKPVVGARVGFRDLDRVKEACWRAYRGKGGVGKTVLWIVSE